MSEHFFTFTSTVTEFGIAKAFRNNRNSDALSEQERNCN